MPRMFPRRYKPRSRVRLKQKERCVVMQWTQAAAGARRTCWTGASWPPLLPALPTHHVAASVSLSGRCLYLVLGAM